MTDPATLAVAGVALVVAMVAGWLHLPRPPQLEGERWFKVMLTTLLRGRIENEGGSVEDWERQVVRFVPFHPAGRHPERKVGSPTAAAIDGAALSGEVGLVEALAKLPDAAARWAHLYDTDEVGLAARLEDPAELGADYDPAQALGPGAEWDDLAAWAHAEGFAEVLDRHVSTRWVLVDGAPSDAPDVLSALARVVGDRGVRVAWDGTRDPDAGAAAVVAACAAVAPERSDRLVLVGAGEGALLVTRALTVGPDHRDRMLGVVAIGGALGGFPDREGPYGQARVGDWMEAWFRHDKLDLEIARVRPWFSVQWLDREADPFGAFGLSLRAQRFPEPFDPNSADPSIDVVDLGVLPPDADLPVDLVAKALWAVVACWSRRRTLI